MTDEKKTEKTTIVKTKEAAQAAIERIAGKPKDEEVYWCMTCGFADDPKPNGMTLKFSEAEMAALGGDLSNYSGPCRCCGFETLVLMDRFSGKTIAELDSERRKRENDELAGAIIGRAKQEIVGGIFSGGMQAPDEPAAPAGSPVDHDDLPDADDVDIGGMKGRSE